NNALCRIIEMSDICYGVDAISLSFACPIAKPPATPSPHRPSRPPSATSINPTILQAVSNCLIAVGYIQQGDWLSGPCLYPAHHQHDDIHPSFGFNMQSGYGNCFRCGSMLLKDICASLGMHPNDYGGVYSRD